MRKIAAALLFTAALALPALAADQTQSFSTAKPARSRSRRSITPPPRSRPAATPSISIPPSRPRSTAWAPGDLILITDIHGDHMDADDVTALSQGRHRGDRARRRGQDHHPGQAAGQWRNHRRWHDWKITAVPMYNINHNQPSGQPYHDKGRGNGYVLNYGGKNFYFAGDTEGMPEMRALKNIDVAFIPDEPALHHDAGRSRRCGQGVPSQGGDPLSL